MSSDNEYASIASPSTDYSSNTSLDSVAQPPAPVAYQKRFRKNSRSLKLTTSDGGYVSANSSSTSTSSIKTVINAARPYRPKPKSQSQLKLKQTGHRSCCVECREKKLRGLQEHDYENFTREPAVSDPYVALMRSVFHEERCADGGNRIAKLQRRLEELLRLDRRPNFATNDQPLFEQQLDDFGNEVTLRLQAIRDVSLESHRLVTAKFCKSLHSPPRRSGFSNIVGFVRSLVRLE